MNSSNFVLRAGEKAFVGAPSIPMNQALVRSISELVQSIPDILEAHLPQCFVPGAMQGPAQILVIVVAATSDYESVLRQLQDGLGRLSLPIHHLDIWRLLPDSKLLSTVRSTGCQVQPLPAQSEPVSGRWKFWLKRR